MTISAGDIRFYLQRGVIARSAGVWGTHGICGIFNLFSLLLQNTHARARTLTMQALSCWLNWLKALPSLTLGDSSQYQGRDLILYKQVPDLPWQHAAKSATLQEKPCARSVGY